MDKLTQPSIIQALLAAGADVNAKNNKGETPIVAMFKQALDLRKCAVLLTGKPELGIADNDGNTALSLAAEMQRKHKHQAGGGTALTLARLFGLGPPGAQTTADLIVAIETKELDRVKAVVDDGAPINAVGSSKYGGDMTPLGKAVSEGHLAIARFLIDRGADVKFKDEEGRTALHSVRGDPAIVKLLVAKGADPNATTTDIREETPLESATHNIFSEEANDRVTIINALLAAGASVNSKSGTGATPLTKVLSAYQDCRALQNVLPSLLAMIAAKADLTIVNQDGESPRSLALNLQKNCEDPSAVAAAAKLVSAISGAAPKK